MSGLIVHRLQNNPSPDSLPLTVHFVYPTKHLKDREENTFKSYWEIQKLTNRVKFHVGLSALSSSFKQDCDVIILDECDDFIFA